MDAKGSKVSWGKRLSSRLKGRSGDSNNDAPLAPEHAATQRNAGSLDSHDASAHPRINELKDRPVDLASSGNGSTTSNAGSQAVAEPSSQGQTAVPLASYTFWTRGYIKKRDESPDLILAYEALIAEDAAGNTKPVPSPVSILAGIYNKLRGNGQDVAVQTGDYFVPTPDQMAIFIEGRMRAIQDKAWKIPFSQKTVDFQKQVQRVVRGVLYVKDTIGPLMSSDPHASIAWAGVCLLLPLLSNPADQKDMLVDGLEIIVSTLCRLTVSEQLYRDAFGAGNGHHAGDVRQLMARFEWESVGMLADIIEYQARVACQTCRGALSTYVRDVFRIDDWKQILSRITKADDSCSKLLSTLNEQKHDNQHRQLEAALDSLNKQAAYLTDVQQLTLMEVQQGFHKLSNDMSELQIQEILEAVGTSNYEKHKRVIPEHVAGTCKWFTEHHQYQSWKAAKSDVLWLAADPGCGKSVLAKHLIDNDIYTKEGQITCYFFFKDGLTEQQGLERALCALLHQLFTQKRNLVRHAVKSFEFNGKQFARSVDKLWTILLQACSDPSAGEIILVLDALDECEIEDRRELVRRVSRFYMSSDTGPRGRLKILMTSRPYHNINVSFQELVDKLPHVHLSADQETAAIRAEIDVVVDHRVTFLARSLDLDTRTTEELKEKLKAAQNRTYLWLRLIFDALETGQGRLEDDRAQLVGSIPLTVQEAYAKILQKCINPQKAHKVFEIMLAAQYPLTVQELHIATSLSSVVDNDNDDADKFDARFGIGACEVFREDVRQACGLFVSVIDGKVYFIHQTAREFLCMESTADTKLETPINLPLSTAASHRAMAIACTGYIALQSRKKSIPSQNAVFLGYAARFWDMHVAMALVACEAETFDDLYDKVFEICECRDFWWSWSMGEKKEPSAYAEFFVPEGIGAQTQDETQSGSKEHADEALSQTAELVTLSMFGLVGVLWSACVQPQAARPHRRQRRLVQHSEPAMLQWLVSSESQQLHIELSLSRDDLVGSTNANRPASKQSYKVFWEKEHFTDLTSYSPDAAAAWKIENGPFAIAESESKEFLNTLDNPDNFDLDILASQDAVLQIFRTNKATSKNVLKFQQLLLRAGAGGHLRELSFKREHRD